MEVEEPPRSPGWYPDPETGEQRYWDGAAWGARWGDEDADADSRPPSPPINLGLIVLYAASFLIPVVGLVASLVFVGRERWRDAAVCLVAALAGAAVILFGVL